MTISVALVDDQTLVREGIRGLLALSDKVSVVAEGSDGAEVLGIATDVAPDIFLMDIRMPQVNGIEAIRALRDAGIETPVIILTTFDDHELVMDGIAAGATGFLLKDVSLEKLIETIESVHAGGTVIQPVLSESLLARVRDKGLGFDSLDEPEALTPRETEVLRLMAAGYSNREISELLHKSEGTIKNHVSNVLAKFGVRDRTRAVLKAIANGMV
ncbi:MAG: response regulator transcription factor [Pseudomonadota bacterium]